MNILEIPVKLAEINCGNCGGVYAINEHYRQLQYEEGGSWTCPYCQIGWGYSKNNENEKLKKQLETEKRLKETARRQLANANNQLRSQKAAKTRVKNKLKKVEYRIKNGVCPCCNRTFKNLQRHMTNKHPHYIEETTHE